MFNSDLQMIERGPPTLGRANVTGIQMLISFKNTLTETPRIMFAQISGLAMHHSSDRENEPSQVRMGQR